ncbi:hypothetical protein J4E93_008409 [Alternaria ventricosa]|uniref:uncharacterized protein n=1 Tax=Alternaria ventricosa TaxID=1187951 RepID=UPI0020C32500|nr:uncharacterized protein J4E93_008409 [Alternaria ventricosa]KAI4640816.1 hypothetical protein J4E93_008409 [Alternaria ventricosa]
MYPVTEEQADEIQNAGEAAQQEFARRVVGIGKDDPEAQAAWQEAQDDVDEQIGADQAPQEPTAREDEPLTNIEESTENVAEEAAEEAAEEQDAVAEPAEGEEASAEETVQPTPVPKGPLMGWTLTVRSQVNGGYVDRPEQLSEYDDWKLEYHLKEIPAETRWKLYSALKARRHELIGQDEEAIDKSLKHYRDVISRYTNRGRKWREEQDKLNDAKGVQVFRPLGPGSDAKVVSSDYELTKETEGSDKTEVSQEQAAEEPYSEESKPDESLSKEKKEEVLDGLPSVPS